MKISKIVSAALLSVAFSSSVFGAAIDAKSDDNAVFSDIVNKAFKNLLTAENKEIKGVAEIDAGNGANTYHLNATKFPKFNEFLVDVLEGLNSNDLKSDGNAILVEKTSIYAANGKDVVATIEFKSATSTGNDASVIIYKGDATGGNATTFDTFKYDSTKNSISVTKGTTSFLGGISVDENNQGKITTDALQVNRAKFADQLKKQKDAADVKLANAIVAADVDSVVKYFDVLANNTAGILNSYDNLLADKIKDFNEDEAKNKDNKIITLKTDYLALNKQLADLKTLATADGFAKDYTNLGAISNGTAGKEVEYRAQIRNAVKNLKTAIEIGLPIVETGTTKLTVAKIDEVVRDLSTLEKIKAAATTLKGYVGDQQQANAGAKLAADAHKELKKKNGTSKIGETLKAKLDFIKAVQNNTFTKFANEAIVKDGKNLSDRHEDFAIALVDVNKKNQTTKNLSYIANTPAGVVAQLKALDDAVKALANAQPLATSDAKFNATRKAEALKSAIRAGAIVKGTGADANKVLTEADVDAILNGKKDADGKVKYTETDAELKTLIGTVSGNKTLAAKATDDALSALKGTTTVTLASAAETLNNFANASLARANVIIATNNSNKISNEVLASLADVALSQDGYELFLNTRDGEDINDLRNSMAKSLTEAASITATSSALNTLNFNNELATNTRLASLANPFNKDLALAKAILNLKDDALADGGNSLASVVSQYSKRFSYDNNIWGNILASKSKAKNAASQSSWGVALGYDRAFDSTIVGGYLGYNKQNSKLDQARNKADSYEFGVYTKSFFDAHEIDAKLSYAVASNKLSRNSYNSQQNITNDASFKSNKLGLGVDYGYVVKFGESSFIKPIIGLAYSATSQKDINENGKFGFKISGLSQKSIEAKLAAEIRSYVSENNYIYVTPGLASEIYKSSKAVTAQLNGSNRVIQLQPKAKKGTYFTVQTGGDFALSQNLSTNVNFGAKLKSGEKHLSGSVGLKYKF